MPIIDSKKIKHLLDFLNFSLSLFRLELCLAMSKYRKKCVNKSYTVLEAESLKKINHKILKIFGLHGRIGSI